MNELITWLRAQLDEDERGLRAGLAEFLDTRLEYDFRFRLAEVDAKRRIIDGITRRRSADDDPWESADAETDGMATGTLRLLALPYAGRPGYREEWRT